MIENFKIDSNEIDKINLVNKDDKNFRIENLNAFNNTGFPSRKEEDWKFSDTKAIFSKNFKKNINKVSKIGGIILLITGILIITNQLQALGYYLLNIFPFLQNFG